MANPPPGDPLTTSAALNLDANSYTQHRLNHATPEHLNITSRRCFIGPIPTNWLNSHRKEWYKHHLHINYSSRAATFHAGDNVSTRRSVTGLDGNPIAHSFPQPEGLVEEPEEIHDEEEQEEEAEQAATPVVPVPSIPNTDGKASSPATSTRAVINAEGVLDSSVSLNGADSEAEASTAKAAEPEPKRVLLSPSYNSKKAGRGMSKRVFGSPEGPAKSERSIYVDAPEFPMSSSLGSQQVPVRTSTISSIHGALSSNGSVLAGDDASTSPLILHAAKSGAEDEVGAATEQRPDTILHREPSAIDGVNAENGESLLSRQRKSGHVNFNFPEESRRAEFKSRVGDRLDFKRPLRRVLRRRNEMEGRIIKMERMLVRLDITKQQKLPEDFDENSGEGVITQTLEKWREFMVVCRQASKAEGSDFVLQVYKTRVIPAVENSKTRKKPVREIPLGKGHARVNLYSSLDKTVVLWVPDKRGTRIGYLRPRTISEGVEWLTFLRGILGVVRPTELLVNVPDLSINLRLEDPFKVLDHHINGDGSEDDDTLASQAVAKEQVVAQRIIKDCLDMLRDSPQYADIIEAWTSEHRIGLAWKRYDRLEWIHGVNERKMYGSMAMIRTHELELRPKLHYATNVETKKGKDLQEPSPVEGFLIRMTSQKGAHQRLGRRFNKKLYFHTHDQYLFFSQPSKADPPPPPSFDGSRNDGVPETSDIVNHVPLIYAVNPYPLKDGQIMWLSASESRAHKLHHDANAMDEFRRKINNLNSCEGVIDLCNVKKIRKVHPEAQIADLPADDDSDSETEDDAEDDVEDDDESVDNVYDKSFEIVLKNGLLLRLQAYDKQTKKEWKQRLRALVKYWRNRHISDMELLKDVRKENLNRLQIDEETEAVIGQFAKKWEVTKSVASAELYNMCGISCCRAIHMSGPLYRKPRLHSVFTATQCVLVSGKLMLFATTLRTKTGRPLKNIHQDKMDVIDLKECYLYSGLLTENDLLYQNQTFDANNPGHHALPRMWMDDEWTSRDEDVMSCFVIWRPLNKGWFRTPKMDQDAESSEESGVEGSGKKARLKRVSQLGTTGRSIVFKARSRVERDRWVLAIATEIERLGGGEDVRITEGGKKNA
ncbi:hypothetical protein E6O75_ATG00865 [Venturia nashicola]|uniref:PH domain-containing protein n=1 Tax=Venturia nashicola TaxID=86259 RepID=A0A4Z1PAC7_9PEZI|nr:hypothetical protein E6O75_ATG00865 [Venturia nashicola]